MGCINNGGRRSSVHGVSGNPPQETNCQYKVYTKQRLVDTPNKSKGPTTISENRTQTWHY